MHRKAVLFAFLLAALFAWGCGGEAKDPAYDISGRWQPDGGMTCEGNTDSLVLDSLEAGFDPDRLEYVIEQDDHHVTIAAYRDGVEVAEGCRSHLRRHHHVFVLHYRILRHHDRNDSGGRPYPPGRLVDEYRRR